MPKSLVLGNGNILVGFDIFGQIKDFYFPYVGLEDQVNGFCGNKTGVFVDGQMNWLNDGEWEIKIDYQKEALASNVKALNRRLELELNFVDVVYNEKDIFIKKILIKNLADRQRQIKVFFNQQFQFYESNRGNTAYYNPQLKAIVHYKGKRVVIVSGLLDNNSFDDYATGLMGIEGKQSTAVDAEDGFLSKNAIEYGSVDSTIGFSMMLDANGGSKTFHYWIVVGQIFKEVQELHKYVLARSPEQLIETTQNFWRAWVNKLNFSFYRLDQNIVDLFKKSLLIIRTHIDNRGGILASCDADMLQYGRDTYSYVWPRDAAFIVIALNKAGYSDIAKRFFEFCNDVIDDSGYLLHKYRVDKSLGSSWHPWLKNGELQLPIQEDEIASALYALWKHYEATKDLEFIESIYNSFIKKAAEFILNYRESKTGLPFPSYDLWEEKFGISTYTSASVVAALEAAANFAKLLGKETARKKYAAAAQEIKEAILKNLYDVQSKFFYKLLNVKDGSIQYDKTIDISSFYGIFNFNILDIDDLKLTELVKTVEDVLFTKTEINGIVRYLDDDYYRANNNSVSNPWIICTLWVAQFYLTRAKNEKDLEIVKKYLQWVAERSVLSGILSEQVNPHTGEQLSVAPLIWSHAEFVNTVIEYLRKLEKLGIAKVYNQT